MRRFGLFICSMLLQLCLVLLALSIAVSLVFGRAANLKLAVAQSTLYQSVLDNFIEDTQKNVGAEAYTSDPGLKAAARQVISPELAQKTGDQVIDGTYDWLRGKAPQPTFKIEVTPIKQAAAENIGRFAALHYSSLPMCTRADLQNLNFSMSALDLNCQVPGVTASRVIQEIEQQVLRQPVVDNRESFTAADLPKNASGKTIFQQFSFVPVLFRLALAGPWIFGSLTLVSGAGVVVLSATRRRGLGAVGRTLLGTGIFTILEWAVTSYVLLQASQQGDSLQKLASSPLQRAITTLLTSLFRSVIHTILLFGIGYIVLGLTLLVGLKLHKAQTSNESGEAVGGL